MIMAFETGHLWVCGKHVEITLASLTLSFCLVSLGSYRGCERKGSNLPYLMLCVRSKGEACGLFEVVCKGVD